MYVSQTACKHSGATAVKNKTKTEHPNKEQQILIKIRGSAANMAIGRVSYGARTRRDLLRFGLSPRLELIIEIVCARRRRTAEFRPTSGIVGCRGNSVAAKVVWEVVVHLIQRVINPKIHCGNRTCSPSHVIAVVLIHAIGVVCATVSVADRNPRIFFSERHGEQEHIGAATITASEGRMYSHVRIHAVNARRTDIRISENIHCAGVAAATLRSECLQIALITCFTIAKGPVLERIADPSINL